jgi:predicted transcriptional regulator
MTPMSPIWTPVTPIYKKQMAKIPEKIMRDVQNSVSESFGIEGKKVSIFVSKDRIKLPPNIMVFQAFAFLAATKLKPATNRILMLLFSKSGYENFVSMDVLTISEELIMSERSVIRSMNELIENNIVIKIKGGYVSDRRRNEYYVNPMAAWKGNSYTRLQSIKQTDKNQLSLFTANETKEENEKI